MLSPSDRQAAFADAIRSGMTPAGVAAPSGTCVDRRFSVYRNNVVVGLVDALSARFPVVEHLVGTTFFRAMAREFVLAAPPETPVLLEWGAGFPAFVQAFPPAAGLPYLADVARLELTVGQAYHAADAPPLTPGELTGTLGADAGVLRFELHPSLGLLASPYPVVRIWQMHQPGGRPGPVDLQQADIALVLRAAGTVEVSSISPARAMLLGMLRRGCSFGRAFEAALGFDPLLDPVNELVALIGGGLVISVQGTSCGPSEGGYPQ